jgi:cytidyltransferase-like protein
MILQLSQLTAAEMLGSLRKRRILAKIFCLQFSDQPALDYLETNLETDRSQVTHELEDLAREGFVTLNGSRPKLTDVGRREIVVVMAGGAFDIIHPGHLETLDKARALGDVLVVSVARDKTFEKNKKRKAFHGEKLRQKLVSSIKSVDVAVLGSETNIFDTVVLLKPDVIALGYDQHHTEESLRKEISKRGMSVKVVRLDSSLPGIKTSKIAGVNNGSS